MPVELPDDLESWLRESATLPDAIDSDRLQRSGELFIEHGLQMSLVMSTASLVSCYAATKGVKALTYSNRLRYDPYHRAAETSQFILRVLAPGGLGPEGNGIRAIQKVRLLHASLRYHIARSGSWEDAELGVPLCQEDMLLAYLTFSLDVVDGLDQLGVPMTDQQADDYLYVWEAIGRLLGIRADLLPRSMAESRELRAAIARRQYGPSPEGVMLTRALLEMHERVMPGDAFDGLIPALLRLIVGEQVADWMEVPRGRWDRLVRHYRLLGRYLEAVDRSLGSLGNLVDEYAYHSLNRMAINAAGYRRAGYEIPEQLGSAWSTARAARQAGSDQAPST